MKKQIRALALAVLFALSLLPAAGFAANELPAAAEGTITLTEDVTLALGADIENVTVDLAGFTLKVTGNHSINGNVTIKNGKIDVTGAHATRDAILQISDCSNDSILNLEEIEMTGDGYSSAFAVMYVYNSGTLNITSSKLTLSNEQFSAGGVIKAEDGVNGKINIFDTEMKFTDAGIGFLDGTVELKESVLEIEGGKNAINGSVLTLDNADVSIKNGNERGITVTNGDVVIKNGSTVVIENMAEAGIRYKAGHTVTVQDNSKMEANSVEIDNGVTANVKVEEGSGVTLSTTTSASQGTLSVKDETGAAIEPAQGGTYGEYVAPVVAAPVYGGPVMNWVKVNAAENGVVKSGPLAASAGATITLYPKASAGYVLDTVEVLDAAGNAVAVDGLKFQVPLGGVTVNATFKAAE